MGALCIGYKSDNRGGGWCVRQCASFTSRFQGRCSRRRGSYFQEAQSRYESIVIERRNFRAGSAKRIRKHFWFDCPTWSMESLSQDASRAFHCYIRMCSLQWNGNFEISHSRTYSSLLLCHFTTKISFALYYNRYNWKLYIEILYNTFFLIKNYFELKSARKRLQSHFYLREF